MPLCSHGACLTPPSHQAGCASHSQTCRRSYTQIPGYTFPEAVGLSFSLTYRHACVSGLSEGLDFLFTATGMDLLARVLDCGMLGWAAIHALSLKDLGVEVGSWTVAAGP